MKQIIVGILIALIATMPVLAQQRTQNITPQEAIALQKWLTGQEQAEALKQLTAEAMANSPITMATTAQPPPPGTGPFGNYSPGPYTGPAGLQSPQWVLAAGLFIAEVVIIGGIAYIVLDHISDWAVEIYAVIGTLWDKIFNSPPPDEPGTPSTNAVVRKITFTPNPNYLWVAKPVIAVRPAGTNNWHDRLGNCPFTNVCQMTVQCREDVQSPWTNFFTITSWSSQAGVLTRFKDGNFNPIYTNYVFRATNGIAWASPPPSILSDPPRPKKFYRTALIPR